MPVPQVSHQPVQVSSVPREGAVSGSGVPLSPRSLEGGSVDPVTGGLEREIVGIGAVLLRQEGALRIRDVLPNSPAALANLSGCAIESIDGISASTLSLEECVRMIRGFEGSALKLEVIMPDQERRTIDLVRSKIQIAPPVN
jgi:C-terminal processing protease CtpA/Prc